MSGGGFPGPDGAMGGHAVSTPYQDVAHCLNAGGMGRIDYETESFVVNAAIPILEPGARTGASTTDPRAGMGVGADGDPMFTLQAGKQHGVACVSVTGDIAHTLNTANNGKGRSEDGTGRGVPTISFSSKDYVADATEDMAPTLRAGGHADSHANAGVPPAVTVALRGREGGATAEIGGEVATTLRASGGGGDKPHVLTTVEVTGSLACNTGPRGHDAGNFASNQGVSGGFVQPVSVAGTMAVRRLTPTECERLQGFPDGHTDVPYRKKPAADGPRYKALGNSMAVPVMRWIGERIVRHLNGEI